VMKQYKSQIASFSTRHNKFINRLFQRKNSIARNENLEKKLGVHRGIATDIMAAQDECRLIVAEVTPLENDQLLAIQKQISNPFIAGFIEKCNKEALIKIADNKNKQGYKINETPVTEADKLFESIIKKYTGKVVYVDFWATWCGPCRINIERIKPLKQELSGKDVVFVYLTNQTSPKETWDNMIPDIKGEHYRVSSDEWNYLSSKFNVTGIPHIVLVDKNGKVVNPDLQYMENNTLKTEIEKLLKK